MLEHLEALAKPIRGLPVKEVHAGLKIFNDHGRFAICGRYYCTLYGARMAARHMAGLGLRSA